MEYTKEQLAELEKKAHAFDSEQGRLRKAQEELDSVKAERDRFAKQAEEAAKAAEDATRTATLANRFDNEKGKQLSEVIGDGAYEALKNLLTPMVQELEGVKSVLTTQQAERAQAENAAKFLSALEEQLSSQGLNGLTHRIYKGDLSQRWADFRKMRPSVAKAESEGDVSTVSDLLNLFVTQNKEAVLAAHSPTPGGGSGFGTPTPTYTDADYLRDKAELDKQLGSMRITQDAYKASLNEIAEKWAVAGRQAEQKAVTQFGLV